jgi:hypothetical protein
MLIWEAGNSDIYTLCYLESDTIVKWPMWTTKDSLGYMSEARLLSM